MAVKKISAGSTIYQSGQKLDSLLVIAGGNVKCYYKNIEVMLGKGDVIGLCDLKYQMHSCTYVAIDDTDVIPCICPTPDTLSDFLSKNEDMTKLFITAMTHFVCSFYDAYLLFSFDCQSIYENLKNSYDEYRSLCIKYALSAKSLPGMDNLTPLSLEDTPEEWLTAYYDEIRDMDNTKRQEFFSNPNIACGYLLRANTDFYAALEIFQLMTDYYFDTFSLVFNSNRLDLFDLYTNLSFRLLQAGENESSLNATLSKLMILIENTTFADQTFYRTRLQEYRGKIDIILQTPTALRQTSLLPPELVDSAASIMEYANFSENDSKLLLEHLNAYKQLTDKTNPDDTSRAIRLALAKDFYKLYQAVFMASLREKEIPVFTKMFLFFGYLDESLAGVENASYLYELAQSFPREQSSNVYTVYDWLLAIYNGKKEPSRNEFDTDYSACVHEKKISGKITEEQEKQLLNDTMQKVLFELTNVFPVIDRVTYGRITSFCPVFSDHNVIRELSDCVVTPDKVSQALRALHLIDFSAFYREVLYTNEACDISKDYLQAEILPDVILYPNVGSRGIMWQEIEGRRRNTPARMMLSIFSLEDLFQTLVRLTGEYRWEMCRRVQGSRWNDVTEASLTSEFCDYAQFYRKNHDLSADAKEKIKLALQKAKNSYKTLFINDYCTWILFEGNGTPRLNKVARGILFKYCPFSSKIRKQLEQNPLYKDYLTRYEIHNTQKKKHYDLLCHKIQQKGGTLTIELIEYRAFLES